MEKAEDLDEDLKIYCCSRRLVKEEGDILLMVREEVNDLGQKPPIHVTVPTEKKNDNTD